MKPRAIGILVLVTFGGMAALSWELLWQIQASLTLGISAFGTAITLAATMAGMTTGSIAMGRWLRDREPARPMRLYGGLEAVVGVSGLLMLPGFRLLEAFDTQVYALAPSWAAGLHIAGIALLLGPPTIAMGATIPVFALVARAHRVSVAVLYGANTAGAALGVLGFR